MTLADMKGNKQYQIAGINTKDSKLFERLIALGMNKGAKASLLEKSIDSSNIAIISNNTRIALRIEEAKEVIIRELS